MGIKVKIALGVHALAGLVEEFRADENGATAIEYGLIVSGIFLAILAGVKSVSNSNSVMYDTVVTTLQSASP